jgi:hypothetical protein
MLAALGMAAVMFWGTCVGFGVVPIIMRFAPDANMVATFPRRGCSLFRRGNLRAAVDAPACQAPASSLQIPVLTMVSTSDAGVPYFTIALPRGYWLSQPPSYQPARPDTATIYGYDLGTWTNIQAGDPDGTLTMQVWSYDGYPEVGERLGTKQLDLDECVAEMGGDTLRIARFTLRAPDGQLTRRVSAYRDFGQDWLRAFGVAQDEREQQLQVEALMSISIPSQAASRE